MGSLIYKSQSVAIDRLVEDATDYLRESRKLRESTVTAIRNVWKQLISYMKTQRLGSYTPEIGDKYLEQRLCNVGISFSEHWPYRLTYCIRILNEFYKTGKILQRERLSPSFESGVGRSIKKFLQDKASQGRFSEYTISHDRHYLSVFLEYCNRSGIHNISDMNIECINAFLDSVDHTKKSLRHHIIRELRLFLRYQYERQQLKCDLSRLLPTDAYRTTSHLPSIYTKDEINILCSTVDRTNALGKRNYAILILLSRYGLRASDICDLCFENILWNECLIVCVQYKTKEKIELPLITEVGEALIDYLRYGRPKHPDTHVFLQGISPYRPVSPALINAIVSDGLRNAHIDTVGRKHGPHALRHSLATLLLKEKVALPVITGILGHKNSESTKDYLRLDTENLKQCALEVSQISCGFYNQDGGMFYE